MASDLEDLSSQLDRETGKLLTAADRTSLLKDAVPIYNGMASTAFTLSGTVLDRDATDLEKRALVLCGLLAYLEQKLIPASENAVQISNVAGKTDLSSVEWALAKRRKELFEQQLTPLLNRINDAGVMGEVKAAELGETLEVSKTALTPVNR